MTKYITYILTLLSYFTWAQSIEYANPVYYTICDDNGDGITSFSLDQLQNYALDYLNQFEEQPEIYVTKAQNGIAKITNLYNNPQVINVCDDIDNNGGYYDIAVNSNKEIFIVRQGGLLQQWNIDNCTSTNIGQIHANGQSVLGLSFDTEDNLYEGGWTSKVFRANTNDYNNFYEWHDFGFGRASGDFVMINGFMYVGWTVSGTDYLYKVTVDDDFQYVRHEDLGPIENETYGLAAEYGRLYGITPDYLYEIDLETLNTTLISNRPALANTQSRWWGAAGLHEAREYNISFHDTPADAVSGNNQVNNPYINTIPFFFTLYIRIAEVTTDNLYIIPVKITVNQNPQVSNTFLRQCFDETTNYATFTLSESKNNISTDNTLSFTFYKSLDDLYLNQNALDNTYNIIDSTTVYANVESTNGCSSIAEVELIVDSLDDLDLITQIEFCKENEVLLSIPTNFLDYQWTGLQAPDLNQPTNTHEIVVTQEGTYTVTVTTQLGCTQSIEFTTTYAPAASITSVNVSKNNVTVFVEPIGNYEYSLDGVTWQSSNVFNNLPEGNYTILAREINGCMTDLYNFSLFNIPNFISPNADGYNDHWVIPGLKSYPNAIVQLFDRYGKLIIKTTPNNIGLIWDGKYNGSPLPSTNYWYIINIEKENRLITGSLLLKN